MSHANESLKRQRLPPSPAATADGDVGPGPKKLRSHETVKAKVESLTRKQKKLETIYSLLLSDKPEFKTGMLSDLAILILEYHGCENDKWFVTAQTIVCSEDADEKFVVSTGANLLNSTLAFSVNSDLNSRQSILDIVAVTAQDIGHAERIPEILRFARDACFYTLASKLADELTPLFFEPAASATRVLNALSNVSRIQAMLLSLPPERNTDAKNPFPVIVDPVRDSRGSEHFNLVREVARLLGCCLLTRFRSESAKVKRPTEQNIDCFWVLLAFVTFMRNQSITSIETLSEECETVVLEDPERFGKIPSVVPMFQSMFMKNLPERRALTLNSPPDSPVYIPASPDYNPTSPMSDSNAVSDTALAIDVD